MEVTIVSGDRDLLQLATDHILIRIPKTVKRVTTIENYHTAEVLEKYSLLPKQIIDLKALMGDTADNIPGLPGVGENRDENPDAVRDTGKCACTFRGDQTEQGKRSDA